MENLILIVRYIEEFETTLLEGQMEGSDESYADRLIGNPIHAFNLLRRLAIDFPKIETGDKG